MFLQNLQGKPSLAPHVRWRLSPPFLKSCEQTLELINTDWPNYCVYCDRSSGTPSNRSDSTLYPSKKKIVTYTVFNLILRLARPRTDFLVGCILRTARSSYK